MCDCKQCKTFRKLERIIEDIPNGRDKKWLEDYLFNYIPELEFENECNELHLKNVRYLDQDIYKKCLTLEDLSKKDNEKNE